MEAQLLTQQSSQTKVYPMRIVSVVFGNPRSPECAGYGICRLDEDWPPPEQTPPKPKPKPPQKGVIFTGCPRYQATVERVETADGTVYLSFNLSKKALTADILTKYFSESQFTVGSALHLPTPLAQAFDMAEATHLKAGLYPIIDKKTYFNIQIQTT